MNSLEDLIKAGILTFAELPQDNPTTLDQDLPWYTVPLIAEDYPAKTPAMWNAVYRELGMPDRNIMMVGKVEDAQDILTALKRDPRYVGGGAGVGFKDASVPFMNDLHSSASEVGAVNFISATPKGRLVGYNTDGVGYAESLVDVLAERAESLAGKNVLILGAGGTSNAVSFALARKGAVLTILNRTVGKAENLAGQINETLNLFGDTEVQFGGEDQIADRARTADVIVNVSTKGAVGPLQAYSALAPAEGDVAANLAAANAILKTLKPGCVISDIVLAKEPTPMMRAAKEAGFTTLDGLPMVINQGVEAFCILYHILLKKRGIEKSRIKEIMRSAATQ